MNKDKNSHGREDRDPQQDRERDKNFGQQEAEHKRGGQQGGEWRPDRPDQDAERQPGWKRDVDNDPDGDRVGR